MNKEKVKKLLSDKEFIAKLISQKSKEDVKNLLNAEGIAVTDTDLMNAQEKGDAVINKIKAKCDSKEINEKDLEEISGGGEIGALLGGTLGAMFLGIPLAIVGVGGVNMEDGLADQVSLKTYSNFAEFATRVLGSSASIAIGVLLSLGGIYLGSKIEDSFNEPSGPDTIKNKKSIK